MFKNTAIKVRAWSTQDKLMVRISALDCKKGNLYKPGYELFLFTGALDKNDAEIYDGDILLYNDQQFITSWEKETSCWIYKHLKNNNKQTLTPAIAKQTLRLCHYYESEHFK